MLVTLGCKYDTSCAVIGLELIEKDKYSLINMSPYDGIQFAYYLRNKLCQGEKYEKD